MSDDFQSFSSSDEVSLHSLLDCDRTLCSEEEMEDSVSQQPMAIPGCETASGGSVAIPDQHAGPNAHFTEVDFEMMVDLKPDEDLRDGKAVAYLNLARNHMPQVTASAIARAMEAENRHDLLPIDLVPIYGTGSCRLIFESEGKRDWVMQQKLSVFNVKVNLMAPRTTIERTFYLYNVPRTEEVDYIESWLQTNGFNLLSTVRTSCHGGCDTIGNSGLSFRAEVPRSRKVKGFANFPSKALGQAVKIRIYHPGMSMWCRFCSEEGHMERFCPMKLPAK